MVQLQSLELPGQPAVVQPSNTRRLPSLYRALNSYEAEPLTPLEGGSSSEVSPVASENGELEDDSCCTALLFSDGAATSCPGPGGVISSASVPALTPVPPLAFLPVSFYEKQLAAGGAETKEDMTHMDEQDECAVGQRREWRACIGGGA